MLQVQDLPSSSRDRRIARGERLKRLGIRPIAAPRPIPPITTAENLNASFRARIMKARADKISLADRPATSPLAKDFFHLAWEKLDSGVLVSPVEVILRAVARRYGLSRAEIISHRRARDFVRPRQVAMWLVRRLTKASFPVIAEQFGGRHHTGVMHGVKQVERFIRQDEVIADELRELMLEVKATVREAS